MDANDPRAIGFKRAVEAADSAEIRRLFDSHPAIREVVDGLEDGKVSPLRTAAWYGHADIVKLLLERGADRASRNPEDGKIALELALERGHDDVAELLR